jgi:hypothetical protein
MEDGRWTNPFRSASPPQGSAKIFCSRFFAPSSTLYLPSSILALMAAFARAAGSGPLGLVVSFAVPLKVREIFGGAGVQLPQF